MNLDHFSATVDTIVVKDSRYGRDAYFFVRDALEFITKQGRKRVDSSTPPHCHVSGQQLLEGVRQYALREYGPMVPTVFEHWRVYSCEDIGAIVFNLIEAREFGKSDHDTLDDFRRGFDFHDAFVKPFLTSASISPATGKTRPRMVPRPETA